MTRLIHRPEPWVFLILLGTYSAFWQARDWNSASRLMLTYAIVDHATVSISGLEDQTHDRAFVQGRFYTDKLPGLSLLGVPPYLLAKLVFRLPSHPLDAKGFPLWPADYWVTLGTSGLLSALAAVVLVRIARSLGCSPRRAALVGLAYGLATPAFPYATLCYGHQASAFALIASFALIWQPHGPPPRPALHAVLAGFLASYAAVIEFQVGLVSAILGLYLLAQALGALRKPTTVGDFAVGALVPTLILLVYNFLAFGSPCDMGYFHLTTKIFADVHSTQNPLGLHRPDTARAFALIWGRYRGLLFYAPILILTPFGMITLIRRGFHGAAIVSLSTILAVFAVNLSYPEWTGGWTTGPRLLVPLIPFALIPVAALLASPNRIVLPLALLLSASGAILMLLFVAVGARVPQFYPDPLLQVVLPLWRGATIPGWTGEPFARSLLTPYFPTSPRWLPILPLVIAQSFALILMFKMLNPPAQPPQ